MNDITPPERGADCPSAAQLEYLVAGEVAPSVSAHVATCAGCGAYFRSLHDEHQAFNRANPPELLLRKLERREPSTPERRWRWWALAAVGAAAMVTALLLGGSASSGDAVGLKGGGFSVYASRSVDAAPMSVPTGAHVSPGDVLRFQFTPKHSGYLMIVDLDGADHLTVFHPYRGRDAVAVSASEPYSPTDTIQLDSSVGPERIGAIFRPTPFTSSDVSTWLASGRGSPGIPTLSCADCAVEWVVLEKP